MRSQLLFGLAVLSSSAWVLSHRIQCAASHVALLYLLRLSCSGIGHGGGHSHEAPPTSPECGAADSAFLTTLAYCINAEWLAYARYRTGEIAFALLPLVIILSGRNNIFLWMTNWSHSTFMLLHRWVARIFALHTILHSIFLLAAYKQSGTYSANTPELYW